MLAAICDDTKADAEKINFALMGIADDLETVCFDTGAKLLDSIRGGAFYALVFLDIYLDNEMGVDIARAVKELSPNTQIIFVTTSLDHAIDAFKVQAVDYLVKPCSEMDIVKAFEKWASGILELAFKKCKKYTVLTDPFIFRTFCIPSYEHTVEKLYIL